MVEAPIFHANGDEPEAVVFAAKVAAEYRQQFGKDVVIDMFCYRRFGHNEGDDPTMTQPAMYRKIKAHPSTRELYGRRLIAEGVATQDDIDGWIAEFDAFLEAEFEAGKTYHADKADWLDGKWAGLARPEDEELRGATAAPLQKLRDLGLKFTSVPAGFDVHRTVGRVIEHRHASIETGENIDWATAEHLAFAALLGFEYGFSLTDPKTLTLWEAQFGDFANGAQVVVDQFISSGERKWLRMSGLVMLLPHGYEGQGPEHSSARLERYLQL